jgi:hypothetical protein
MLIAVNDAVQRSNAHQKSPAIQNAAPPLEDAALIARKLVSIYNRAKLDPYARFLEFLKGETQ